MKKISIQELKSQLSSAVAEAEAGATIVITRHNEIVARLGPVGALHRGAAIGTRRLRPAIRRAANGRYLAVLAEDRGSR